jgi:hypothetical protein
MFWILWIERNHATCYLYFTVLCFFQINECKIIYVEGTAHEYLCANTCHLQLTSQNCGNGRSARRQKLLTKSFLISFKHNSYNVKPRVLNVFKMIYAHCIPRKSAKCSSKIFVLYANYLLCRCKFFSPFIQMYLTSGLSTCACP